MQFYIIDNHRFDDKQYAYGEQLDQNTGDAEKCEFCGSYISSKKWRPPYTVKLSKPLYGDFVFGTIKFFLASQKFKDVYIREGLIGIKEFQQVEVVKVSRKRPTSLNPPTYYNVIVGRGTAKIDETRSNIVRDGEVKCEHCRSGGIIKSYNGIFLEEGTWDGEDIFTPRPLSGTVVVSSKFYDFVKANGFTNINLVKAEEYIASWAKHSTNL